MSVLAKRVAKLEVASGGEEELIVQIDTFGSGDGEYTHLQDMYGGDLVARKAGESEDAFLSRAKNELIARAKSEGRRRLFTFKALRKSGNSEDGGTTICLSIDKRRA